MRFARAKYQTANSETDLACEFTVSQGTLTFWKDINFYFSDRTFAEK